MEPGKVIDDRFKIVKPSGKGGQGEVYLVHDMIENNAKRALKTLRRDFLPKDLERMKSEVNALKGINSNFVMPIISTNLDGDLNDPNQVPYFVTDYARYGTLRTHNYYNGEITLSLRLFRNLCEGILDIHKAGVIHRDLKPSNILLVENEKDVKVGDFGICYLDLEDDEKRATKIREKVGPIYFAAPEQTSLPPNFTKKSDIYSLGRILYFLITGVYEFTPADDYVPVTIQLGKKDSDPVDNLIGKMISFDPKARYDTAEEVIAQINKILGNKQERPRLKLSKMQRRIMKFLESDKESEATIEDILDYLSNFYDIRQASDMSPVLSPFEAYGKLRWSKFADMAENSLDQLEEEGLLNFRRGSYSLSS